eukprot:TRINITY_DN865_c0_g1_i1.p1 TRINITY_DN865_c0_g1~~TRINITY_DN865_c0_g1_i1.p1  ORF type:complete len:120 (-),score=11.75 TRINITY_DN865_c0_g1_i1:391-750(-)
MSLFKAYAGIARGLSVKSSLTTPEDTTSKVVFVVPAKSVRTSKSQMAKWCGERGRGNEISFISLLLECALVVELAVVRAPTQYMIINLQGRTVPAVKDMLFVSTTHKTGSCMYGKMEHA